MIVLAGYQHVGAAPRCPYCGDRHYALEDHGRADFLLVRCWCGATARIQRDDQDLAKWPGLNGATS